MTQKEEKRVAVHIALSTLISDEELLLADLLAKFQYGVYCRYKATGFMSTELTDYNSWLIGIDRKYGHYLESYFENHGLNRPISIFIRQGAEKIPIVKPYLRPLSSMTEEEKKVYEYLTLCANTPEDISKLTNWLDKKMFDHRGLIPRGLAIEVTGENNPY